MSPLPDPQGLLEEPAQVLARGPLVLRIAQREPHLPEDLALADDHRVEAADHREQVLDGTLVVVDVEVRRQVLERQPGPFGEQLGQGRDPAVEPVDHGVDLDSVARRDHDSLSDVLGAGNLRA